ncbi:MAG: DUF2934 domain-containing protein [Terriglobales bacterium]
MAHRRDVWQRNAPKPTDHGGKTEQLEKRVDRHPDEIEKKPSTLVPKSDELTVLIPIEQQIQQRAYELYEQRGRTDGHELDDWLQAECEIKGTQANAATA